MAEKHQQVYPLAPANGHARSDAEMANSDEKELKRKKRIKLAIYIAIFAVFQIIVITVFGLVVMRAKSPKFRLSNDFAFQSLESTTSSFSGSFTTQVRVKNPNWGPYKYDNATVVFTFHGATVGTVVIPKGKAGMKGTKKVAVTVNVDSNQVVDTASLGSELSAGTLTLTSTAKMTGKVELMLIMKKKKSADMNCTIVIDVRAKTVNSLECK